MRFFSFLLCLMLTASVVFTNMASADGINTGENDSDLSDNDILLIEKAVESTLPDSSFSAAVSLASVIINRYRSDIYPDSVLKIIEGSPLLRIDHSTEVSERSRCALRYALLGASPIKEATGAVKLGEGELPPAAEYIITDGWCFYAE